MSVDSVLVNGQPATFTFVQPTYPGDPNGDNDPDPRAHAAGQLNPVGGPTANPLPPACAPPSNAASQIGLQCPANKLVITPSAPIPSGSSFVVTVNYTGRPGVHTDGDGTTEGWFRSNSPVGDGSFVTTEPVGTEDWMPLNNHPSAKPTYDFYDTVPTGKTAIANGELISTVTNAPDLNFPGGSVTWHWHSPEGIAAYLITNSVGAFDLSERIAASGIQYYEAQGSSITAAKKATNKAIMDQQEDIVNFQSMFNGPFPFTTDGVVIGIPSASFEEEMQTKITFDGGTISLGTFNHENMHQWWGDNVSESNYNMTFFKEGMATLGEYLNTARSAQTAAGGPGTPAGDAAFETSLVNRFNTNYAKQRQPLDARRRRTRRRTVSSRRQPPTRVRALRTSRCARSSARRTSTPRCRRSSTTTARARSRRRSSRPGSRRSCRARPPRARRGSTSSSPSGSTPPIRAAAARTSRRSPGRASRGRASSACRPSARRSLRRRPTGQNGWYLGDVSLAWNVDDGGGATTTGCVDQTFSHRRIVHGLVHRDELGRHGRPRVGDGEGRQDEPDLERDALAGHPQRLVRRRRR